MFVSKKDAAKALGISMPRIYQIIKDGRIQVDAEGNVDPDTYEKRKPCGERLTEPSSEGLSVLYKETLTDTEPLQLHSLGTLVVDGPYSGVAPVAAPSFLTTNFDYAKGFCDDTDVVFSAYIHSHTGKLYFNLFKEDDLADEDITFFVKDSKIVFVTIPISEIRKALGENE